jgi:calcineurin-like phosphoesterase family protein
MNELQLLTAIAWRDANLMAIKPESSCGSLEKQRHYLLRNWLHLLNPAAGLFLLGDRCNCPKWLILIEPE